MKCQHTELQAAAISACSGSGAGAGMGMAGGSHLAQWVREQHLLCAAAQKQLNFTDGIRCFWSGLRESQAACRNVIEKMFNLRILANLRITHLIKGRGVCHPILQEINFLKKHI